MFYSLTRLHSTSLYHNIHCKGIQWKRDRMSEEGRKEKKQNDRVKRRQEMKKSTVNVHIQEY